MSDAPPAIVEGWYERAVSAPARIVLADLGDPRADAAADRLRTEGLAVVVEPVVDPADPTMVAAVARAAAAGLNPGDPVVAAAVLIASGGADAGVAGATRPTAEVVRAGLAILGVGDGEGLVSSCFILILPDGRPIAYGDCGVVPEPNVEQLVAIARATAATFECLTTESARVALLSFSTRGSATHPRVEKLRQMPNFLNGWSIKWCKIQLTYF